MTTIEEVVAVFPDPALFPLESSAVALAIEVSSEQLSYTVFHITMGGYHPIGQRLVVKEWAHEIIRYLATSEFISKRILLELGVYWPDMYTELTLEELIQRLEPVVVQFTHLLMNQYSTIVHILLSGTASGNPMLGALLHGHLSTICSDISFRPTWTLPSVTSGEAISLERIEITDYYYLAMVGIEDNHLVWQRHLLFGPNSALFQSGNLNLTTEVSTCYFVIERMTASKFDDKSPPTRETIHQVWRIEPARRRLLQYDIEFTIGYSLKVRFYDARTGENKEVRAKEITHQLDEVLAYSLPELQVGQRPLRTTFLVEANSALLRSFSELIDQVINRCDPERSLSPRQEWLLIFYGNGVIDSESRFVDTREFAEQIRDRMQSEKARSQINQLYQPTKRHNVVDSFVPVIQKLTDLSWKEAGARRTVITLADHTPTSSLLGTIYSDLREKHMVRFGAVWTDIRPGLTDTYLQESLGKDYYVVAEEIEPIGGTVIDGLTEFLRMGDSRDIRVAGLRFPLDHEYIELAL